MGLSNNLHFAIVAIAVLALPSVGPRPKPAVARDMPGHCCWTRWRPVSSWESRIWLWTIYAATSIQHLADSYPLLMLLTRAARPGETSSSPLLRILAQS